MRWKMTIRIAAPCTLLSERFGCVRKAEQAQAHLSFGPSRHRQVGAAQFFNSH